MIKPCVTKTSKKLYVLNFYIQSHGILKTLDEHKKLCEEKKSSNFAKVNSTVYNQTVIDEYKYALEGRYRPCLLLSVVLSVGMSIFFRMIIQEKD